MNCVHCGAGGDRHKGVYSAVGEDYEEFICFECLEMEERERMECPEDTA